MRNLQLCLHIHQILHFPPRPIRIILWPWPFAIPTPLLPQLVLQLALQHLRDILTQHGEEFVAVKGATCRDVEAFGAGVRRDDEVGCSGEGVPAGVLDLFIYGIGVGDSFGWATTYQHILCFSIFQSAPFLP